MTFEFTLQITLEKNQKSENSNVEHKCLIIQPHIATTYREELNKGILFYNLLMIEQCFIGKIVIP